MSASAILFSEMTPPAEDEGEFNRWYDGEHIPIRMGMPGFASAQRYRDGDTLNYLAVYELAAVGALSTPEYSVVKKQPSDLTRRMLGSVENFTRYIGNQISHAGRDTETLLAAPVLYAVFFTVPDERLPDFDAWYDQDHVPTLLKDERWLGVRRFDIVDGEPQNFNRLALHYLADRAVLESPARAEARNTPWRAKLAGEPWFKGTYVIFDRHSDRQIGSRPHEL